MRQIAVLLGIIVVPSLTAQVVLTQSENPIRMVYGEDRIVVPGERAGALHLGIGRKEFTDPKMFGTPTFRPLMKWRHRVTGDILSWLNSHNFRAGFCDSNGRMFLAMISSFHPTLPLTTPEGHRGQTPVSDYFKLYGRAEVVINPPIVGSSDTPIYVFPNGLVTAGGRQLNDDSRFWMLGAFNPAVCEGSGQIGDVYVPWLGERANVLNRIISLTGDDKSNTVGSPIAAALGRKSPSVEKSAPRIYFQLQLAFPSANFERKVYLQRSGLLLRQNTNRQSSSVSLSQVSHSCCLPSGSGKHLPE